jgi:glucose-6-phosphate isomerase
MSKPLITYDFTNSLADRIGIATGITEAEISQQAGSMSSALRQFEQWRNDESYGFFDLPVQKDQLEESQQAIEQVPDGIDTLLHIGIGGSSLGPIAIQQALDNRLSAKKPSRFKRVIIQENVDPEGFTLRLDELDMTRTAINVVSKSGGTIETLACFTAALERMRTALGTSTPGDRVIACTENLDGVLATVTKELGGRILPLPHNVGGRFSVLTAVGLLPSLAMGLDADGLLAGAAAIREQSLAADNPRDPCFLAAFLPYFFNGQGKNIHVIFPYSELLRGFAMWCCQLLGESLGKKVDRSGKTVHTGMTPTVSVGSVDQHSLLQLYMEGPPDKFVTFIRVDEFRSEESLVELRHSKLEAAHTAHLSMGTVLNAEQTGTAEALAAEGRPSATIVIPKLCEHTLGQLFYFFELATAFGAELYDIDAFDQPGVEASKVLTIKYLRGEE